MIIKETDYSDNKIATVSIAKKEIEYTKLIPLLKSSFGDIPFNGKDTFMNVPTLVDQDLLSSFERLSTILNIVLKKIVENYFTDIRIRETYQLDEVFESILRIAEPIPYEIGMYRPDFIISKSGQPKICEIGCRYPINGWMLSYYLNLAIEESTISSGSNWKAIPNQTTFISTLINTLDSSNTLFFVHDKEKGTDAHRLFTELKKHGFLVDDISPDELEIKNGQLISNGQIATQFILELDREELKKIDDDVLKIMIETGYNLNDVRTLILIHDKRILSILSDDHIMNDYISNEDFKFLKPFLIPSYTLNSTYRREMLIHSTENWILKKNSGGRGIGIYVKNDCTPEDWNDVISNNWNDYMVQEYVTQETFHLKQNDILNEVNLVGMLLYFNAESFGPGIFRASSESIINVHNGGYILPSAIPFL